MELSEVIIDLVTDTETDASQKSDIEHNINGCDIKDQGLASRQYDVSDQDIAQDSPKTDISKEHNTHHQDPPCPVEQAAQPISDEDLPALEKSLTDLRGIVEIGMTTNVFGIMDKTGIAVNLTKPGDKGTCKPPKKRKNKEGKMDGCYKLKRNKTTTQDIKSKKVRVKPMENKVKKSTSFKRIRKVDSGQNVSVKVLTMHATPVEPHQKYSDIVQVNHSRTGKIHFFSGTIPVFIMADSMEHLQTSDAGDKQVYLICIEKNQIHAMMVDNIKPGVYLINFVKHMCDQKHKFSHQLSIEDNLITWTIQKAILSSYLSSLTDPMPGHHYLVIG